MSEQPTEQPTVSYVYDNSEIIKTGRTATKKLNSGKTDKLLEITPKDTSIGEWKKWVREADLYEITQ